ncbi:MAG: hypothetical protein WB683_08915 [Candidatus Sulfotelmatobacter sp.]
MRYQSSVMIGNIPVISVAFGPDAQSNQNRGRAVGLVAVGDVARWALLPSVRLRQG